ncbi:restriction endonuclease subunit S [Hallella colorans]|uniref:restriction endonuclease subunit S n=1 Tax=Hallella colorans TaxID=1703337 RepID=UPI000E2FF838|nr:restriction endonuclease subunit S [Hallella colorans]
MCYILNNIDLSGYITGSAQPKLNQANLSAISIILPSLNLQEQIADFISMFDNKIELNRRINDNLN